MRSKVLFVVLLGFIAVPMAADARGAGGGTVHVQGSVRSNGTYVAPHVRTAPNSTVRDNYSTKPNVNPYTGKEGTKIPPLGH